MPAMRQETDCLFVYGTLMGGAGHPIAARLGRESRMIGPASAGGRLYDLGTYPGAIASSAPGNRIYGLAVKLARPAQTLAWLDVYEGAIEPDPEQRLFERVMTQVKLAAGREIDAWMYSYRQSSSKARLLPGGRWSARKPLARLRA
jgi:gamma-glutamylcyclotransferase (GGCT)/AIG2-like uncharacterized protein YtfP